MNNLLVLYGCSVSGEAFEPLYNGKNSMGLAAMQAQMFPGVTRTVLLASSQADFSFLTGVEIERRETWTKRAVLERIAELQTGFDCIYFAFADCPFLDPALAGAIAERHLRYAAEYSYADGWPYGLAPEILSPGTAGILANILKDDEPAEREMLFSVIQKDINAFDIETEISPVDLRCHRISFCADSKRNLLLLKNFLAANGEKIPCAQDAERIIAQQPEILRTLPSFYPIQVSGECPQKCAICPYPSVTSQKLPMDAGRFTELLDKIAAFSGDAVIDLSLWGELSLHPQKMELIEAVVSRSALALVIETSGLGWAAGEIERCLELSKSQQKRKNSFAPLSWIVSLDTADPQRYRELRGVGSAGGFAEAFGFAKKALSLFPDDCYVQAVRIKGFEDDTEKFYRYWKETAPGEKNIIIQKYDDFCGALEKKQASDISPVIRQPCWHIMRDMPVLIDGSVPLCREDLAALKDGEKNRILGNVFTDSLEAVWQNGMSYYSGHCKKNYPGPCAECDEYYTFNF